MATACCETSAPAKQMTENADAGSLYDRMHGSVCVLLTLIVSVI